MFGAEYITDSVSGEVGFKVQIFRVTLSNRDFTVDAVYVIVHTWHHGHKKCHKYLSLVYIQNFT